MTNLALTIMGDLNRSGDMHAALNANPKVWRNYSAYNISEDVVSIELVTGELVTKYGQKPWIVESAEQHNARAEEALRAAGLR